MKKFITFVTLIAFTLGSVFIPFPQSPSNQYGTSRSIWHGLLNYIDYQTAHAASTVPIFGPVKYVRTKARTNIYTGGFNSSVGAAKVVIANGDINGKNRLGSADIWINGLHIIQQSNINKKVYLIDRPVSLLKRNTIRVELNGKPTGYLTLSIIPSPLNHPPVANAGPDQIVCISHPEEDDDGAAHYYSNQCDNSHMVTLDGGRSTDLDGDRLSYRWSFLTMPSGSKARLSSSSAVKPAFEADRPGTYVIQLIVNDGATDSAPDAVTIGCENMKPVANAGPDQTVHAGSDVVLNGSKSSDMDGDLLDYRWLFISRPAGSQAALSDATAVRPHFTADRHGVYVIQLVVNDGTSDSKPDTVTITTTNSAPVANAGPDQPVSLGNTVTLDGSDSSDADGDPLTYSWSLLTKPQGSTSALSSTSMVNPTFMTDRSGTYVAQLIVNDGMVSSNPDTVNISTTNSRPVAIAGPDQAASSGDMVTLDGSGSYDADGDPLIFWWSIIAMPAGSIASLSGEDSPNPFFSPDLPGNYIVQLIVNDGMLDSLPDTLLIDVARPQNLAPVVNAGRDQSITLPAAAALSGGATDDGLPIPPGTLTYQWSKVSGPGTVIFGNAAQAATAASFSAAGTYILRLTANDGDLSGNDDVTITVNEQTLVLAPVADRTIRMGSRFQQVLQASSGSGNAALNYALTTAPAGAGLNPAPLIDWMPAADQGGSHSFTAEVSDGQGHTASTTFHVTVELVNHPPQMPPQGDVTMDVGNAFARTLTASDPDEGDTLTFSLVSGPSGMTLTGNNLGWSTTGLTAGDYPVSVTVTDSGGLFDAKQFAIRLLQPVPPVAVDDRYEVMHGQTLTVPAPGVLNNDLARTGQALAAVKLTDPDKGNLAAFNGDGSFTYQAPASITKTFQPVVKWTNNTAPYYVASNNLLAIDVDGDGKPELVTNDAGQGVGSGWGVYGISALRGTDGSLLWGTPGMWLPNAQTGPPAYSGPDPYYCSVMNRANLPDTMAVGDIDDSGTPSIIVPLQCPGGPNTFPTTPALPSFRLGAFDARTGEIKWLSEDLGFLHNGVATNQLTWNIVPAITRLAAGESPTILFKKTLSGWWGSGANETWCNDYKPGTGAECTVVIGVDGSTGARRRTWVAPIDYYDSAWGDRGGYVVSADLTGSGSPSIIADRAVWDVNGTLLNNRTNGRMVVGLALADLDNSGQTAIISYEIDSSPYNGFVVARKPDGTVLWETPTDPTAGSESGQIVVADLYGDGRPKVLVTTSGNLYVYDERGAIVWTHRFVDASNSPAISSWVRPVVFDLDGDGVPELIMQTNSDIQFFDGRTGAIKTKMDFHTDLGYPDEVAYGYGYLSPIVTDLDGDGHAEVVFNIVSPSYGVPSWTVALKSANDDWQPARPVWNQFAMHDANVNDNGSVPQTEINNFATPRTNVFANPAQVAPPVDPRRREQTTFTYKAQSGGLDSNAATVTIDLMPPNRPPAFTSTSPTTYMSWYASGPGNPYVPFVYYAHAADPDPGDTVTYLIVLRGGVESALFIIDANTGKVEVSGGWLGGGSADPAKWATEWIVIAATDSFGATTYQTLTLKPSTGPAAVPNVVGLSKAAADTALIAAGFKTGSVGAIYNSAPVGQVLSQYPVGGASLMAGEAVALQVSQGLQPVAVPDVAGMSLDQARSLLVGFGFGININPVAAGSTPPNMVLGQSPVFGTVLAPPSPLTLDVSIGPPLSGTVSQVIVEPSPSVTRLVNETLNYRATAVFTDGTSRDVTIAALWNSATPSVASIDSTGAAKGLSAGTTTIRATVNAITGQSALNVVSRVAGDAATPTALITSPIDGASVTGPVAVTGTATDANFLRYELAYALAGDTAWTLIAEGTGPVTAGTLGTFDPTVLLNDLYTLRLSVYDRNGNQTDATVTVQVQGNAKPGLFSLTYQDLNIPMTGMPITVTRTYDSRDKGKGDFGVGWRQGFNTIRLRTNRVPGTGWIRNLSGAVMNLTPTSAHKVSISLPDGKVEEFDLVVSPTSGFGGLDMTAVAGYAPRPGTLGQLQALGNLNLLIINGGAEDELVDDITLNTFNPLSYRYTTVDGTQFEVHLAEGIKKITDRNGNNVTFGPAGIIHSSGKSVLFTRDEQGRITQITDPMGSVQTYSYDGNGDLVSRTSSTGDTSHYRYDRRHNIIDILDPAGNHAARNDYDDQGRLIATTDARGNTITYSHNIGVSTELVTDRLGNATLYAYDAMGNVLAKTGPLGHVTTYTYDSRNNPLTVTDPLGRVSTKTYDSQNNVLTSTDFDGNTTTSTYNAFGQVLTRTDPEGFVTTNVYDGSGNLTQVTDPEGGVTTYTYDISGNQLSVTDPLGNATLFAYDPTGNKTSQTDAMGNITIYSYDINGHQITSLDPAGNLTQNIFDASGRVVSTIDKKGQIMFMTYSQLGDGQKVASRIDPMGNATLLDYDSAGNLVRTTYPDGVYAAVSYDAENHANLQTNGDGYSTSFQYDALGRQTIVTYPDGSVSLKSYDPGGRILTQTDERGNVTTYSHAANQQTVTDAMGNVSIHVFDSQRRRLQTTDAMGQVTNFVYDSAGNLVKTIFPDGTFRSTGLDLAKRKIIETDQAGNTTQYAYDAAGRLISVTDALGGVTSYTYNSLGKRLTQTDANAHTTQMSYDAIGRLVSRTRHLGQAEFFGYDTNGNQAFHTDFNGQTSTFVYDSLNRLIRAIRPDGSATTYSYTGVGRRAHAGGDNYIYDNRGRLLQEHKATGEHINYTYDAAGNKTSLITPYGTTTYTYDALNRMHSVTDSAGTVTYAYDAVGNLATTNYPNGVATTYIYDTLNRLLQVANNGPSGLISSYAYTLGPAGNRTQVIETGTATTGRTVSYVHDALYRLTGEQIDEPGTMDDQVISYGYDPVGNRTKMTRNGVVTSYVYDANDRLLTETRGVDVTVSAYDNNGNLKSRVSSSGTETFTYDNENRLISALNPLGSVSYAYDADGMRISKTAGGITTDYLLDKNREFAQVLVETTGALVSLYTYGNQLIRQTRTETGSHYFLSDGQLSTRQLTDTAGTVTDQYTYDAFGVMLASSGSTPNTHLYTGEQYDPNVGFYYLRARFYDQATGRFVTSDPLSGSPFDPVSLHRYLHAHGNPVDNRDPSGQESLIGVMMSVGMMAGVFGVFARAYKRGRFVLDWREAKSFVADFAKGALLGAFAFGELGLGALVLGTYIVNSTADVMKKHYEGDVTLADLLSILQVQFFLTGAALMLDVTVGPFAGEAAAACGDDFVFELLLDPWQDMLGNWGMELGYGAMLWKKDDYFPAFAEAFKGLLSNFASWFGSNKKKYPKAIPKARPKGKAKR